MRATESEGQMNDPPKKGCSIQQSIGSGHTTIFSLDEVARSEFVCRAAFSVDGRRSSAFRNQDNAKKSFRF
jgi:hypothetical protein